MKQNLYTKLLYSLLIAGLLVNSSAQAIDFRQIKEKISTISQTAAFKKSVAVVGSTAALAGLTYAAYKGGAFGGQMLGNRIGSKYLVSQIAGTLGAAATTWYLGKPTVQLAYTKLSGQKLTDRAERRLLSVTEDYATVLELLAAVKYEWHQLQLKIAEETRKYSPKDRAPILDTISDLLNSNKVNDKLTSLINSCTEKTSTCPQRCSLSLRNRYQTLQETVRQITSCLSMISSNHDLNSQKCPTVEPITELVQKKLFDGVHTNYWKYYIGLWQGGNATIKHGSTTEFMKIITTFYASCETCYVQLNQARDAQKAAREVNQSMLAIIEHCTKLSALLTEELDQAVKMVYWTNKLGL